MLKCKALCCDHQENTNNDVDVAMFGGMDEDEVVLNIDNEAVNEGEVV